MRVDSVGIYNNRGLVQNKANNNVPPKSVGKAKTQPAAEPQRAQKLDFTKLAENINQLSSAELNQINKLFGQVDLDALKGADNSKVDDSPGQFVDIIV